MTSVNELGPAAEALKEHFGSGGTVGILEGHTVHYGWGCDRCGTGPVETMSPRAAWMLAEQHNQLHHWDGSAPAQPWSYSMPAAETGQP